MNWAGVDVGLILRRALYWVHQDMLPGVERLDLTPAAYSALTILRHNPGMRLYQLTELLAIRAANCVSLINGLERRELVKRQKVRDRGRAVTLTLTERGAAILDQAEKEIGTHPDPLRGRLGDEDADRLLRLLRKLVESDGASRDRNGQAVDHSSAGAGEGLAAFESEIHSVSFIGRRSI